MFTPNPPALKSATANLRSLSVLQNLSPSTDDLVVVTDEEWQERANAEFYRRHWKDSGAPSRASERIASGQFSGEEWHKANRKLELLLRPRGGALVALIGTRTFAEDGHVIVGRSSTYRS